MKLNNSHGLTLIECLISILLLAIMLAGGMSLYFNSSDIMAQAMHKKIANEMANQAMEMLKEKGYTDAALNDTAAKWITTPESPVSFGDFRGQVQKRIGFVNGPTLKQIEIQTCWQPDNCDDNKSKKIILATYIAP